MKRGGEARLGGHRYYSRLAEAEGFAVHVPDLSGWAVQGPHILEAVVSVIAQRVSELVE